MLPKYIHIAWNLIHILDDQWIKSAQAIYLLETKYGMKTSEDYLKKITGVLADSSFIEAKKGMGIRRSLMRNIHLVDIIKAFNIKFEADSQTPAGKIEKDLYHYLDKFVFDNTKLRGQDGKVL